MKTLQLVLGVFFWAVNKSAASQETTISLFLLPSFHPIRKNFKSFKSESIQIKLSLPWEETLML